MPGKATAHTVRFEEFVFDPSTGELWKGSKKSRLSPHLVSLLEALLENPGELVTRESLRARLWPADTFVDYEHGLTVAVNKLREELGDSAHQPAFVETLPRRGYRWLVPVELVPHERGQSPGNTAAEVAPAHISPAPETGAASSDPPLARGRRLSPRVAVTTVLLLATAAAVGWVRFTGPVAPVTQRADPAAVAPPLDGRSQRPDSLPPEVFEAYQRGRLIPASSSRAGWVSSVESLNYVVGRAPRFAPAQAALARTYVTGAAYGFLPPGEAMPKARAAALEALRLDDHLGDAHVALGDVRLFFDWDWMGAESEYQRALDIEPENEGALRGRARLLAKAGRFDEGISLLMRLMERDPTAVGPAWQLVSTYLDARRFDAALVLLRGLEARDVEAGQRTRVAFATAYVGRRQCADALREADRAMTLLEASDDEVTMVAAGWVYAVCGRRDRARELLRRCESPARPVRPDPISLAAVYGALGETEQGIQLIEQGVNERSPVAIVLDVDPMLDSFRSDPRFEPLAARVRGNRDQLLSVPGASPSGSAPRESSHTPGARP